MSTGIRLKYEEIRSLAHGSMGASYTAVGSELANPAVIFTVLNLTNEQLMFSFDGVTDHFTLDTNGVYSVDCNANKSNRGGALALSQGTIIYVKHVGNPSSGSVYVTVGYQGA